LFTAVTVKVNTLQIMQYSNTAKVTKHKVREHDIKKTKIIVD